MLTACQTPPQGKWSAEKITATGSQHARMDGYTGNHGDGGCNKLLSLKRADVIAVSRATGAPRSNLSIRGVAKEYPVASNQTSGDQAENRPVVFVITGSCWCYVWWG